MADESPSRKRSNPPQPKKSPFASRGVQIGIVLLVIIIAVVAVWAVYPRSKSSDNNQSTSDPVAVFNTTMGNFKVQLFRHKMPQTVDNFVRLVDDGFYNGMIFHRIGANFMIQSGGYFANGTHRVSPYPNIPFEKSNIIHFNGTISMASTGAGVGGSSEFFICDGAQPSLDGKYAAFGIVNQGIDVIHRIATQPHANSGDGTGKPDQNIIINSITIE
jgi:cyclophilin family peptidyl-prolyl cis-trans isomerase